ncbi:tail fiber protein [Acinetobacter phage vB_AbaM_Kimel]|uniref:Long tail fiber, distal part n=1 Tax=Acinetobacter phage vB_AbaM_Kimel TaxID=2686303 RepID=A0A6B9LQH4_9CAUD|nr:tail fiber protein [Acinetobacter phage vB_AbaM_Kimel]QHB48398.1 long tail fiber, distal part [Acinetobacter phage vB_AbaM_Kimel]
MALDSNIGRIKFMRSKTAGAVPSPTLLDEGELAINLVDRTIFSKNGANTVELGFGKGGTVAGPINVTGGNAVTAAQFNGALNGNAATASRLLTGRKINNVVFDGTKDITIEDSTKLYKSDVLTSSGSSRVIRDAATIRAATIAKGAVVIHLPKRANSVNTMMKLCIQGFDYVAGRATQSNWSVDISGYNYTGAAWHSYQAISTSGPAPFDTVRWGQAGDHQVIILGEGGATPSSWSYYNISIEKIYLTNSTEAYDDPNDPIYMAIEADISNYVINATLPLEGVAMAKRLETGRTFTFTGDARGSLTFDGTANVSTALTINSATTGQAGLVKLNNTLTSTSVTEALTAAQGKVLQDTKVNRSGDTISGRLVVTQGITTPSISNDVTVPISFLGPTVNGSNAGGIRVRNLEVNGAYGEATRAFGIFSKDGIVTGDSMSYSTLAALGTGNNIPFKVKDTNVGTTYGFVPFLGGNVQSSSGYRNVVSIGAYRPGPQWDNSGMYMSMGGNDQYSTEAFLFKNGRTIENTNGPIILKGYADTAGNIDATSQMLSTGPEAGWRKLGTATIPQTGRNVTIQIFGGTGFNAGVPSQAHPTTIVLKSGNGNPASINMVVNVNQKANILSNGGWTPDIGASACFVKSTDPATPNDYDIYIHTAGYLYASVVVITGYQTSWTRSTSIVGNGVKPTGAVDAVVYRMLDSQAPSIYGSVVIGNIDTNANRVKNREYTKIEMVPPTHTGGTWRQVLNDTDMTAELLFKYGSVTPLKMDSKGVVRINNYLDVDSIRSSSSSINFATPTGASHSVLMGGLMVSDNFSDSGHIPSNGIYSKGLVEAPGGFFSGDVRSIKPNSAELPKGALGVFFSSREGMVGGTVGAPYVDLLTLNTYKDASGGNINALAFDKGTARIYHYQSAFNGASWGARNIIAYLTDNVASASKLQTAQLINGEAFDGTKEIKIYQKRAKLLTSGTDFNSLTQEGDYYCDQDAVVATMANRPNNWSFSLTVTNAAGVVQTLTNYAGVSMGVYVRGLYSGSWSPWRKLAYTDENVASATKLQTARSIGITGSGASGSVSFDGTDNAIIPLTVATQATATNNTTIATTAFVQNVNVAETGAAAYALRLKTPRTFQVTGGITTNAVAFDGQQNVVLTANAVDGSKVSGVVPEAIKAQTLAVTPQKNAKLVASWKGTILQSMTPTLTIVDANTLRVRLADDNPSNRLAVLRFNVKIGTVYHLAFSNTMLPINGTVTFVQTGLTWVEVDLNSPNHGLSGSGNGVNVMAITYSAYGCYFEGSISQIIGTTGPQDSQWAYVLKLNSPTTDATYNLSGSSQDAIWVADKDIWYLNPAQPVITAGAMISPDRLNFFAADTDAATRMRSNMVTAQIWDIV